MIESRETSEMKVEKKKLQLSNSKLHNLIVFFYLLAMDFMVGDSAFLSSNNDATERHFRTIAAEISRPFNGDLSSSVVRLE